jgi:hypothetical protein
MAYDEDLDVKIRAIVEDHPMIRKKMFGGVCYLEGGKMVCGVWKDNIILRLGPEESARALSSKAEKAKVFDITGKPMKGWIMIARKDLPDAAIEGWISKARGFVRGLE